MTRALLVAAVGLVLATPPTRARAENASSRTIRVTGDAVIRSQPDSVEIDLGVVARSERSAEAARANAAALRRVLSALRDKLGASATIETVGYALSPEYHPAHDGEAPEITGYLARSIVKVTHDDVARAGAIVDTALGAGANEVRTVEFKLRDDAAVNARALRAAAREAREEADALAGALGLSISGVASVVEGGSTAPGPMYQARSVTEASTPFVPGAIETRAAVTVAFEVSAP
jgi:uncharacterized protein YggE